MTIEFRVAADFNTEVFEFVSQTEGFRAPVYDDGIGVPTIGYGYALLEKGVNGWEIYANLDVDLEAVGFLPNALDQARLQLIADALNAGNDVLAKSLIDSYEFEPFISEADGRTLFDLEIPRSQDRVHNRFRQFLGTSNGDFLFAEMLGSKEMVALTSLVYNAVTLIGSGLTTALWEGNRAEAWYEIRFNSNSSKQDPSIRGGLAKRRYYESQLFGLYNDGVTADTITLNQAKEIYLMFNAHREKILAVEAEFGVTPDGTIGTDGNRIAAANTDFGLTGTTDEVKTLEASFAFATKSLKDYAAQEAGNTPEVLAALNLISFVDIQVVDDAGDILTGNIRTNTSFGSGIERDDLLIGGNGEDVLLGGGGQDVLVGGEGNDYLEGGAGTDYLIGGAGHDTYFFNLGDGVDHIIDSGVNTLIFNGNAVKFLLNDGSGNYTSPGVSNMTVTHNSPLTISDGAGTEVVIDNWVDGDFGIKLFDITSDPISTLTIQGDRQAIDQDTTQAGVQIGLDALGNVITNTTIEDREDILNGSTGNDHIISGNLNDEIYAGTGDDFLDGGAGQDLLAGDVGNDVLIGGADSDVLDGGDGNDRLYANSVSDFDTIFNSDNTLATTERDFLSGGNGDDLLVGNAGENTLFGGGGSDLIIGGAGNDHIIGDEDLVVTSIDWTVTKDASGSNVYSPSFETDTSLTGAADALYGGGGDDYIAGGLGDDVAYGNSGKDLIFGDEGNDTLFGGSEDDQLQGDNNKLAPSLHGSDYLDGGAGNDLLIGFGGDDILYGGSEDDELQGDNFFQPELTGNDILYGEAGKDSLYGGSGNDTLSGGTDNDFLFGGEGNDTYLFNLGDGHDQITDTAGLDKVVFGAGITADNIDVQVSGNNILIKTTTTGDLLRVVGNTVENFIFSDGSILSALDIHNKAAVIFGTDTANILNLGDNGVQASAKAGNDVVNGGLGRDIIFGGLGNDTLFGNGGDDQLSGDEGDDQLSGGAGDDVLIGDAGNDTYFFNLGDGFDAVIDSSGIDSVVFGAGIITADIGIQIIEGDAYISVNGTDDLLVVLDNAVESYSFTDGSILTAQDILNNATVIFGSTAADVIIAGENGSLVQADSGDDTVTGGAGNDVIFGELGNDTLNGNGGADSLYGESGHDILDGGLGNDTLIGGTGNDQLLGGGGNDTYIYNLGSGTDTLIDSAGINILRFGAGINAADVTISQDGLDVIFSLSASEQVRIVNGVEVAQLNVTFIDDSAVVWDPAFVLIQLGIGGGNGNIIGTTGNDVLQGTTADDIFIGSGGDDTFIYNLGDGLDRIETTYSGSNDKVTFGAEILKENVVATFIFVGDEGQLQIRFKDSNGFIIPDQGLDIVELPSGESAALDPNRAYGVEFFEFADGTVWNDFEIRFPPVTNSAPILTNAPVDVTLLEDGLWSYTLPVDTFSDPDVGDTLGYNLTLADGTPLPTWLQFDTNTLSLSGIPDNADVGLIALQLTATDQAGLSTSAAFNITVENINDAPVVSLPLVDQIINEDGVLQYTLSAGNFSDIDTGDTLTYQATLIDGNILPSWLVFDSLTRTFSGTPQNSEVGNINVRVTATDTSGSAAFDDFVVTVENVNDAPVLNVALIDQFILENTTLNYQLPIDTFSDIDIGDSLSYNVTLSDGSLLPAWLNFDVQSLTFTGIPANADVGVLNVRVVATDTSGTTAFDDFSLNVTANVNTAPVLNTPLSDQLLTENTVLGYQLPVDTFTDSNLGDSLTYSATLNDGSSLPTWLSFDATSLTFSGTPLSNELGQITIKVTAVDDAGASVSDTFNIGVEPVNGELVSGTTGDDILTGGLGDDYIEGFSGNDTLSGAAGSDLLIGGEGIDTYVYNLGDGIDYIHDSGDNILRFGRGINLTNISLALGSLKLNVGDTGDAIHIVNFNPDDPFAALAINQFEFDDGTVLTYKQLIDLGFDLEGTNSNDIIKGTNTVDRINGFSGDDILSGAGGDDIYIYNIGDGKDSIIDSAGINTLFFGTGINAADVTISQDGLDIIFSLGETDLVRIVNGVEVTQLQVKFTDDATVVWDPAFVISQLSQPETVGNILGTSGNDILIGGVGDDYIEGFSGDDTLNGGQGNDILDGGAGNDTYVFYRGAGVIRINETLEKSGSGIDKVVMSGLSANDVELSRDNDDVIITISKTGEQLILQDALSADQNSWIENIYFNGEENSIWTHANLVDLFNSLDEVSISGEDVNEFILGEDDDGHEDDKHEDDEHEDDEHEDDEHEDDEHEDESSSEDALFGESDTVTLNSDIAPHDIVFQSQGDDLLVSYNHGLDRFSIEDWYSDDEEYETEEFLTSDGHILRDNQVAQLIQAMSTFSQENGGITWEQAIVDRPNDVQTIVSSYWQTTA